VVEKRWDDLRGRRREGEEEEDVELKR